MKKRRFGWIDDPMAVRVVAAGLETPLFGATAAGTDPAPLPDSALLWQACRQVLGDLLPPRDQGSVGSCVGFGTVAAIEHTLCAEIAGGDPDGFHDIAPEIVLHRLDHRRRQAPGGVDRGLGGRVCPTLGGSGARPAWHSRYQYLFAVNLSAVGCHWGAGRPGGDLPAASGGGCGPGGWFSRCLPRPRRRLWHCCLQQPGVCHAP